MHLNFIYLWSECVDPYHITTSDNTDNKPPLLQCCASIRDAGPALKQRWSLSWYSTTLNNNFDWRVVIGADSSYDRTSQARRFYYMFHGHWFLHFENIYFFEFYSALFSCKSTFQPFFSAAPVNRPYTVSSMFQTKTYVTEIENKVCGRCSIRQITQSGRWLFSNNSSIFRHLKLQFQFKRTKKYNYGNNWLASCTSGLTHILTILRNNRAATWSIG